MTGRIWPVLTTLARLDIAASVTIAATVFIWLALH
jgi:hypothetical protein